MYYGVWVDGPIESGFSFRSSDRSEAREAYEFELHNAMERGYTRVRLLEVGQREIVLATVDEWAAENTNTNSDTESV